MSALGLGCVKRARESNAQNCFSLLSFFSIALTSMLFLHFTKIETLSIRKFNFGVFTQPRSTFTTDAFSNPCRSNVRLLLQ